MISAIHPDSLEGYFETTNWCLKFLMFGWRVLYSEVTTKIFGIFSTLFLYGFPLVPFLNFCSKILWLLAKFSTFYVNKWRILQISIHFRQELVWRWVGSCGSRRLRVSVEFSGRPARFSVLYDLSLGRWLQHWSTGYSTGSTLGTLLLGHASPCFMTYKPRKWVSPEEKQGSSSNDECHRALRALFWQNETLHNSRKHVKMGNGVWRTGLEPGLISWD